MDVTELHLEIRNALSLADELSRHAHVLGNDTIAGFLAGIRTSLGELERTVGASHRRANHVHPSVIEPVDRSLRTLREGLEEVPIVLRPRLLHLMETLERVVFASLRPEAPVPAKRAFGIFPIARVVPQTAHSILDYVVAGAYLLSAGIATSSSARATGLLLGTKVGGASLFTDYELAASQRLPIEMHEAMDYGTGVIGVTAPLVLGYRKRDRVASAIQMAAGIVTIVASLFTDYRAHRGVARAVRSHGMRSVPSRLKRAASHVLQPSTARAAVE